MELFRFGLICSMLLVMGISALAQSSDDRTQPNASANDESDQLELTISARFNA